MIFIISRRARGQLYLALLNSITCVQHVDHRSVSILRRRSCDIGLLAELSRYQRHSDIRRSNRDVVPPPRPFLSVIKTLRMSSWTSIAVEEHLSMKFRSIRYTQSISLQTVVVRTLDEYSICTFLDLTLSFAVFFDQFLWTVFVSTSERHVNREISGYWRENDSSNLTLLQDWRTLRTTNRYTSSNGIRLSVTESVCLDESASSVTPSDLDRRIYTFFKVR